MIDTSKYDKGIIKIKAYKADLGFEEVTVKLNSKKGLLVKARAIEGSQGQWVSAPIYPYRPSTT